ncbi:hypothetical protein [Pontiella agarivorans]|uniref:Peptidase S9 prolyl oligopeptidase catalytic domain-containing protein n=1 Tax=Pontiella agarivorans TaxID=3038953 RepID=A0ABU5MU07_9BACT|nr:hypothetical protein [Pontiella agarivorans]MDZ8117637.1 hypothetical protein [Pontiella agarivorans]
MKKLLFIAAVFLAGISAASPRLQVGAFEEERARATRLDGVKLLRMELAPKRDSFASVLIHPPEDPWDFSGYRRIVSEFTNIGDVPVTVAFWAVGRPGWDAAVGTVKLAPGERAPCSIDLAQRWPGGRVPKVDSGHIEYLRVSFVRPAAGTVVEMEDIRLEGNSQPLIYPEGYKRLEVPAMVNAPPAPGLRVKHQLKVFREKEAYHALYLPPGWTPGKRYPVIVEYSGNRWLNPPCHSPGRPESGRMGFGMSEGKGFIWVNAPFVNRDGSLALNGWGDADVTADYAVDLVKMLCADFGGDPDNVILTGFSRGAVACGYIGLRNDKISSLWKAFHPCQHYDGDGVHGATFESALNERMPRLNGRPTFHTDNGRHAELHDLFEQTGQPVTFAESGIGAHTDSMLLENRPSTLELRAWLKRITAAEK